ncbi:ICP22 family protein [Halostella salina]|uniref:hypothetical protein n=1 Tax=Halostella salina TaxID=1547897 RepID=UPI000EF77E3D|nr:hypothetical protein [Halostella salina]
MTDPDLEAFVERARASVAGSDDLSVRNTELRLVQPFLAALGWDVHGQEMTAGVTVEADRDPVNYALAVDGRPAVFVDVVACEDPLREADADRLAAALDAAGVSHGVLTNGRSFVFLARGDDRLQCRLDELPDRTDAVAMYSRAAAASRVGDEAERRTAAERIAAQRGPVADDVTARLVAAADGAAADDIAAAVDEFLDDLTAAWGDDAPDGSPSDQDGGSRDDSGPPDVNADRPKASAPEPVDEPAEETREDGPEESDGDDEGQGPDDDGETTAPDSTEEADDDGAGEYVVRFFDGRTSVGAIGTDTPIGATAAAVEYLIEQHALDAGLSLPWRPDAADDDGRAVLAHDPVHPNGTPMRAAEPLSNGSHLLATLDAPSARTVVEELAGEAGLRTMFQGDW